MRKIWKSSALLLGTAAVLGAIALSGTKAEAAAVEVPVEVKINKTLVEEMTSKLSFGEIDLVPGQVETITLDAKTDLAAAESTATKGSPIATYSSFPGVITIKSANTFKVNVVYPTNVSLVGTGTNTSTVTVADFITYSTATGATKAPGADHPIYIGGKLSIPADTPNDTYSGKISVTVSYAAI